MLATARTAAAPPCNQAEKMLTSAALGGTVLREGGGLGPVSLGNRASDVERAWGGPVDCFPRTNGASHNYFVSDDGGDTSLLVAVVYEHDTVTMILATLLPHAKGPEPSLRTGRGVKMLAPIDEVRRIYGAPVIKGDERSLFYPAEGIAFLPSAGRVGGILLFKPGAMPTGD